MSEDISGLLKAASAAARPVFEGIPDDRLGAPTPCAEYDVRELLNHLFLVVTNFQVLASGAAADFSETPDRLTGDWRAQLVTETERLAEAWGAPGALDGVSAGMGLPQRTVGLMGLLDMTVHPWDLARATGQDFTPDPGAVTALLGLLDDIAPMARKMSVLGEAVEAPADATPFERLLAASGREPR
ncbi:TIGR03086 family metal-binding protein [Phytomonospora sp. NPDC050363]|uniref:TIGR03086 family metal-binding protein n=1 Tax=Phytomonospora sp. NPDC050363 TaxID=3155642 RepID=UPI0033DC85F1